MWCTGRKVEKTFGKIKDACIFALPTTKKASLKKHKRLKKENQREISSAGSEHLPYKQGVTGSNPVSPTKEKAFQRF
jgi:hypothetical protein